MPITVEELIRVLERQPKDTKILIEDSTGYSSEVLEEDDVFEYWERDDGVGGTETVMMLSKYR